MGAHAASLFIQGHPGLQQDFGNAAVWLHEYAAVVRVRENRDIGTELAMLLIEGGLGKLRE